MYAVGYVVSYVCGGKGVCVRAKVRGDLEGVRVSTKIQYLHYNASVSILSMQCNTVGLRIF